MEKRDYTIILYDFYSELFSERQREYFEAYYFNNLTLSEIGQNLKVSRNAVHKALRIMESKLNDYEEKLHLYEKRRKMDKILETVTSEELIDQIKEVI